MINYLQSSYDEYTETDASATLKASGGNYGGGVRNIDN